MKKIKTKEKLNAFLSPIRITKKLKSELVKKNIAVTVVVREFLEGLVNLK